MVSLGSSAHSDLSRILEIIGITRFKEKSLFSPRTFKSYRVFEWFGLTVMISSCFTFIFTEATSPEDSPKKLQSLALGTAATQFMISHLILVSRSEHFDDLVAHLRRVFDDIREFPGSLEIIGVGDKQSRSFLLMFGFVIFSNIPSTMLFALIRMVLTGDRTFPFEMSVFGMPTALGWAFQMFLIANAANVLWGFYCILKTVIYLLGAYSNVLAHMLRERPTDVEAKDDRQILKLFCDINSLSVKLGDIYGLISFIEVSMASGRCCFLAYHILLAIQNSDYKNLGAALSVFMTSVAVTFALCSCGEDILKQSATIRDGVMDSKWYAVSPHGRKTLLPVLMFTQRPIQFHFRRFVYFNMETFRNVLKTTYTMTTALAQV